MAGYKITSNKSVAFLYTNDKQAEKEIREITLFTIARNKRKYLGATQTKQVKDLYDSNLMSLKKVIKEDLRKWNDPSYSWIGRINIVKMAVLPKAVYRFNAIPIKFSTHFFIDMESAILKFILKKSKKIKSTLNNKRTSGGTSIPDIKKYYKAIGIKTAWHWYRDNQIDQWYTIEDPEIKPYI